MQPCIIALRAPAHVEHIAILPLLQTCCSSHILGPLSTGCWLQGAEPRLTREVLESKAELSARGCARAQLNAVLIAEDGGIVTLSISGFQRPLAILVGQAEALALVHSAGADLRRPSTLATWRHCLAVCCPHP